MEPLMPTTSLTRLGNEQEATNKLVDVTVRMYRPGLGDCYLLRFRSTDGKDDYTQHMLIDCGVLQGSEGGADRMRLIAQDISQITHNKIDYVVATHEHWDHLSGFRYARDIFEKVMVDQVWLAWTENADDDQVKRYLYKKQALALAIDSAVMGMDYEQNMQITELLRFAGAKAEDEGSLLAANSREGGKLLRQIMDQLRDWGKVDYRQPGEVIHDRRINVKFHVLGPSRMMGMFQSSFLPSNLQDKRLVLTPATSFLTAIFQPPYDELKSNTLDYFDRYLFERLTPDFYESSLPFDYKFAFRDTDTALRNERFCKDFYGHPAEDEKAQAWRRIDAAFLQGAEAMALRQVSIVNNTSLVLAIELSDSGQVLLFPGDAEEENWETWQAGEDNLDVLLKNTVLYKVGHHGSINATPTQGRGLNLMTHGKLIAMIPVDIPRAERNNWLFPAPQVMTALDLQTKQRVILNCTQVCSESNPQYNPNLNWPGEIVIDESPNKLWVDYILKSDG